MQVFILAPDTDVIMQFYFHSDLKLGTDLNLLKIFYLTGCLTMNMKCLWSGRIIFH
jgi:hypothetical protein